MRSPNGYANLATAPVSISLTPQLTRPHQASAPPQPVPPGSCPHPVHCLGPDPVRTPMVGGRGRNRGSAVSPVCKRDRVGRAVPGQIPGQIPPHRVTKLDPFPVAFTARPFLDARRSRPRPSPLPIPSRHHQPSSVACQPPSALDPLSSPPRTRPHRLSAPNSVPSTPDPSRSRPRPHTHGVWAGSGAARARTPRAHAE